jgi:copper resistance protein B
MDRLKNVLLLLPFVVFWLMIPLKVGAMGKDDDPWLTKAMVELESYRAQGQDVLEWELASWYGRDLTKFWFKTEGEYIDGRGDSEFERVQLDVVFSRAVARYWDIQLGVRRDFEPQRNGDNRSWLVSGLYGLAPGFWRVDANLYVGEASSVQFNIEIERELMLTQRWVLIPEVEATFNGNTNRDYDEGGGVSDIEASVRLGYQFTPKFMAFVGINGQQSFGATKNIIRSAGEDAGDLSLMLGIEFWL